MNVTCYANVDPVKMSHVAAFLVPLGMYAVKEIMHVANEAWHLGTELEKVYQKNLSEMERALSQSTGTKAFAITQELDDEKANLANIKYIKHLAVYSACTLVAIPIILASQHCYN